MLADRGRARRGLQPLTPGARDAPPVGRHPLCRRAPGGFRSPDARRPPAFPRGARGRRNARLRRGGRPQYVSKATVGPCLRLCVVAGAAARLQWKQGARSRGHVACVGRRRRGRCACGSGSGSGERTSVALVLAGRAPLEGFWCDGGSRGGCVGCYLGGRVTRAHGRGMQGRIRAHRSARRCVQDAQARRLVRSGERWCANQGRFCGSAGAGPQTLTRVFRRWPAFDYYARVHACAGAQANWQEPAVLRALGPPGLF